MSTSLTEQEVTSLGALSVFDQSGSKVKLGSVWEQEKTLVVWIRHFFCGYCKMYITELSETIDPKSKVVVIGCGSWEAIKFYKEETKCPFPIFADPSVASFKALKMTTQLDPKGAPRPEYLAKTSPFSSIAGSIWSSLTHLGLVTKGGDFRQNGGELVLGPGNASSTFVHIMKHSTDHTEIEDLIKVAQLQLKPIAA
ncbi:hypothetical protein BDY24DRAFT_374210 [Mrakia frigida]|uniref:peroxiredoxin-like family protein n=1 Tax=Mrakia frigida TaxID=29902 RepID=UPI003FCC1678